MAPSAWFTVAVLFLLLVALALELFTVDMVMMGGLVLLVATGVIDLNEALQGFANSTLLALGSLYVVAGGLRNAGVLDAAAQHLLGEEATIQRALARLCPSVSLSSAFLNNTPIVAMAIPAVSGWAKRHGFSPSKLLMPVSFAAMLGGVCTLIGTSTNLVSHGLLQDHGMTGLGFFELAWVGVPCALVGLAYLVWFSHRLLPDRTEVRQAQEEETGAVRAYEVQEESKVEGQTVRETVEGDTSGYEPVRLRRGREDYGPVSPEEELEEGDILVYEETKKGEAAGAEPGSAQADFGLELISSRVVDDGHERAEQHEVVIREGSPLIGKPLEELEFPERFGAAVTGVRRGGKRVKKPLGKIKLQPGDILLMETHRGFREAFANRPEFFVTSRTEEGELEESQREHQRETPGIGLSLIILVGIVVATATGLWPIAVSGTIGAMLMIVLGYLTPGEAREEIDWSVLIVIGASLGLGHAMESTGAAEQIGVVTTELLAQFGPHVLLAGLFVVTSLLTNLITNNGAAAIFFPVAVSIAQTEGLDPRPFIIGLTVAASTSMITPIGYQTNLMVYGPGNYRFTDFTLVGGVLQLIIAAVAVVIIPIVWGF